VWKSDPRVVWLVPIFGIYFAVRLFHAGDAPQRLARPLVFAASALALKLAGTFVMESHGMTYAARLSMNFIVTLIGIVLAAVAWPTLSKALLVYGYLSRIPVAIVCVAAGARITMPWIPDFLPSASGQPFSAFPSSRTSFSWRPVRSL